MRLDREMELFCTIETLIKMFPPSIESTFFTFFNQLNAKFPFFTFWCIEQFQKQAISF